MFFRKITILLVGLIFTISYSQEYNFNLLTVYKSNTNPEFQEVVYSNTNDNTYFLKVYKSNNQNRASISDLKRGKIHIFNFLESQSANDKTYFEFDYVDSDYLNTSGPVFLRYNNYVFDFEIVSEDSLLKTVRIVKYRNEKRKKIIFEAEIKIVKFKANMFPLFRFSCMHPYEHSVKLNYDEKGIVKSYKSLGKRKSSLIYLDLIEEVNFQIKVD